ncbi:toll/interleukin-1 receptor domain-containing protein [Komagataeibacter europaeus]|uniref:toll/interleukin-1 receptor domain-containing protein n=1 Tax=Komagataeibacter europaeus TaxID=33995 RepID=UPI000B3E7124|nr:toll/interleukin-1 receptor domain-containing protein [Komagataeibacter europaeus]ARW16880.1 hypothetical protein S101446_01754 [Komagataeibacter europaeus]
MALPTRPFLVVYIVRHPDFAPGQAVAETLYDHFRRKLFENVAGGTGLSVIYRSVPPTGAAAPLPIDFDESETAAVVVLFDETFAADDAYVAWLKKTAIIADANGLGARVFPVAVDAAFTRSGMAEQAIRWDKWDGADQAVRARRLISSLTYQFARMLRSYLERLRHPADEDAALERYLKKVQVFLSHSKRDADGERIAKVVRQALFDGEGLSTFFDVHDIAPGLPFDKVIPNQVRVSAVVAIHTDTFSSREWCRREIIEAKRANVPLVIANCLADLDERGFPYMGNVPVVRMDPACVDRIDDVIGRLLDEVLKDFLWRCRIEIVKDNAGARVRFLPRPPELISLAGLDRTSDEKTILVYPDPPLGAEEQRLFEEIAPDVWLRSLTEWVAEAEAAT